QGGFIEQVMPNSAAEEAGIKPGDVIIKVNGKNVKTFHELRGKIGSMGAGKKVNLTIVRNGNEQKLTVKLKQSKSNNIVAADIHRMFAGAKLENNSNNNGVIIKDVADGSAAQMIGLQAKDVIMAINRTPINNIAELRNYIKDKKGVFALNIIRNGYTQYLMVR
ncbi:MAG: PDZ domain-containing protein, partial [Colwellia sp.]